MPVAKPVSVCTVPIAAKQNSQGGKPPSNSSIVSSPPSSPSQPSVPRSHSPVIVSDIQQPSNQYKSWDKETVRQLLAIVWLLFVLDMGLASFLSLWFGWQGDKLKDGFERPGGKTWVKWVGTPASGGLQLIGIGAFICLSLVVAAYVRGVGWVAVAFTSTFGVVAIFVFMAQGPIFK